MITIIICQINLEESHQNKFHTTHHHHHPNNHSLNQSIHCCIVINLPQDHTTKPLTTTRSKGSLLCVQRVAIVPWKSSILFHHHLNNSLNQSIVIINLPQDQTTTTPLTTPRRKGSPLYRANSSNCSLKEQYFMFLIKEETTIHCMIQRLRGVWW